MTRRSIMEYAQALRGRYFGASREEKGKMLDEFTKVTGLHRKAAIRLLHRTSQQRYFRANLSFEPASSLADCEKLCQKSQTPGFGES